MLFRSVRSLPAQDSCAGSERTGGESRQSILPPARKNRALDPEDAPDPGPRLQRAAQVLPDGRRCPAYRQSCTVSSGSEAVESILSRQSPQTGISSNDAEHFSIFEVETCARLIWFLELAYRMDSASRCTFAAARLEFASSFVARSQPQAALTHGSLLPVAAKIFP